jgi:uncharacterized protein (DUF1697 family)
MPTYISMLRGINVVGHKPVNMNKLRALFEGLGCKQVRTYIQSGNVVFKAARQAPENLSKQIEEKILSDFGFPVWVISKTSEEMGGALHDNPFLQENGIDPLKLHVTFLSQAPAPAALRKLDTLAAEPDRFRCFRREIYLHCPNGYGRTKLSNNALEKALSVTATTRNWRTVNKLYEMAMEQG